MELILSTQKDILEHVSKCLTENKSEIIYISKNKFFLIKIALTKYKKCEILLEFLTDCNLTECIQNYNFTFLSNLQDFICYFEADKFIMDCDIYSLTESRNFSENKILNIAEYI